MSDEIKRFPTAESALCYLAECCLATVEWNVMIKRFPKGELRRHISIAKIAVAACKDHAMDVTAEHSRVTRILCGQLPYWWNDDVECASRKRGGK